VGVREGIGVGVKVGVGVRVWGKGTLPYQTLTLPFPNLPY